MKYISKRSNTKFTTGFTLIEMLVSIAVFMIVMIVAVGSLASVVDANKKAQTIKSAVSNLDFALESMTKLIRTGTDYRCYPSQIRNEAFNGNTSLSFSEVACFDADIGTPAIRFISQESANQTISTTYRYRLLSDGSSTGLIERCEGTDTECNMNTGSYVPMTSSEVKITDARFFVIGAGKGSADNVQPQMLITISGYAGSEDKTKTSYNVQTSVTQRISDL
ncbi:MAG: type II secretion system protein [Candidatus Paceibacterota bacterium]|jgi:type II secretory pathway pseudopilin PulG